MGVTFELVATPTSGRYTEKVTLQIIVATVALLFSQSNAQGRILIIHLFNLRPSIAGTNTCTCFIASSLFSSRATSSRHLPREFLKRPWGINRSNLRCLWLSPTQYFVECDQPVGDHKPSSKHGQYYNTDKHVQQHIRRLLSPDL